MVQSWWDSLFSIYLAMVLVIVKLDSSASNIGNPAINSLRFADIVGFAFGRVSSETLGPAFIYQIGVRLF